MDNIMSIKEDDNNVKKPFNYKSLQDYIDNNISEKGSKNETHQLVKDDGYRTNFIVYIQKYIIFQEVLKNK